MNWDFHMKVVQRIRNLRGRGGKAVYAIRCGQSGKFLYVGQTKNYRSPSRWPHKYEFKWRGIQFKDVEFHVLRRVVKREAMRIEGQVIRALKRRGQCSLNTNQNLTRLAA